MTVRSFHDPAREMGHVVTRPAVDADWTAIEAVLTAHALPIAGARDHLRTYRLALDGKRCVGVAGSRRTVRSRFCDSCPDMATCMQRRIV